MPPYAKITHSRTSTSRWQENHCATFASSCIGSSFDFEVMPSSCLAVRTLSSCFQVRVVVGVASMLTPMVGCYEFRLSRFGCRHGTQPI
jgi:hypothetical protein